MIFLAVPQGVGLIEGVLLEEGGGLFEYSDYLEAFVHLKRARIPSINSVHICFYLIDINTSLVSAVHLQG